MGAEIFHALKKVLKDKGYNTAVGDEGGFAPDITNDEALDFIMKAIEKAGYKPGEQIAIALDCASSELFDEGGKKGYKFWKSNPDKLFSAEDMIDIYTKWVAKYPIISIEDPLDQNDWEGYVALTRALGSKVQIVGDDFFVTNTKRLENRITSYNVCYTKLLRAGQPGSYVREAAAILRLFSFNSSRIV